MLTLSRVKLAAAMMAFCSPAIAAPELITFEDLPNPPSTFGSIPSGYAGFDWGIGSANASYYAGLGVNGDSRGAIGNYDAVTSVQGAGSLAEHDAGNFDLNSFYLTAGWQTNLHVVFDGYRNSILVDTISFTVSDLAPTLETLNWTDLSEVTFQGSGGTGPSLYTVVLDNITVNTDATAVSEPASLAALASGLAILFLSRTRLTRRHGATA